MPNCSMKPRSRTLQDQRQREILIKDISMWLDFEKRDLKEMQSIHPWSEEYRRKWLSAGSFHGMANALYIFGLRAGLLSVDDFAKEFFGNAA